MGLSAFNLLPISIKHCEPFIFSINSTHTALKKKKDMFDWNEIESDYMELKCKFMFWIGCNSAFDFGIRFFFIINNYYYSLLKKTSQ
jgi:hypothetical protein